jgi:surface polysaccharide O-acyltransferase-like enzyme
VTPTVLKTGGGAEGALSLPVDLIRFVAIILVVLCHAAIEPYTTLSVPWETYVASSIIYNAISRSYVPLFFMLSGALLLQPNKVHEPILCFLKKRVLRICIAFAFWSTIYFLWDYLLNQQLTARYIIQTVLSGGPHYQFWYIYAIVGLYLATPVLRAVVGFGERKILGYLAVLGFLGASGLPFLQLFTGFSVDLALVTFGSWVGYFVVGAYLVNVQARSKLMLALLVLGFIVTAVGSWLMVFVVQSVGRPYYFTDFLAPNVVMYSLAMFMLLKTRSANWPGNNRPRFGRFVRAVSENTLPIFFFHALILEVLEKGFLGFTLSVQVVNPVYEIPLAASIAFSITLGLVVMMKKVPILKTLIG